MQAGFSGLKFEPKIPFKTWIYLMNVFPTRRQERRRRERLRIWALGRRWLSQIAVRYFAAYLNVLLQ
jgi:hypothetical protein